MINEIVMKPGRWQLQLRAGTPKSIRDLLRLETAGFGHVIITGIRLAERSLTSAVVLASARYTGIYRDRPSEFQIGGPGMVAWISDEDGKGDTIGSAGIPGTFNGDTFQSAVTALIPVALTAGTIEAAGGSVTASYYFAPRRDVLDAIVAFFGREYRVNPNGTFDAGLESVLYPTATTPTAVVQPVSGGRESGVVGIHATELDALKDLDDYTTEVVVVGANGFGTATISPATSYKDLQGNAVRLERALQGSSVGTGNEAAAATAELAKYTSLRRGITLKSDAYDIGRDIRCGDTIYIWDPDRNLYDLANQVQYRGQLIFPLKARVYGSTWPVEQGMGVYFRDGTGAITDLSDYIEWDTGGVSLDVGASRRPLFSQPSSLQPVDLPLGVLAAPWTSYSPLVVQSLSRSRTVTSARYVQVGKTVRTMDKITMTGAGSANQILLQLPVLAANADLELGTGTFFDASANTPFHGHWYGYAPDLNYAYFIRDSSAGNAAESTALASTDVLFRNLSYEAA